MELIGKFDRFLLLGDTKNTAFIRRKHMSQSCSHVAAASRSCWRFLASLSEWIS